MQNKQSWSLVILNFSIMKNAILAFSISEFDLGSIVSGSESDYFYIRIGLEETFLTTLPNRKPQMPSSVSTGILTCRQALRSYRSTGRFLRSDRRNQQDILKLLCTVLLHMQVNLSDIIYYFKHQNEFFSNSSTV